jgi:hypothetical protein
MRFSEFQGLPNKQAPHEGPVTVGGTAARLTSLITLHAATRAVIIQVEAAALRMTFDQTAPTATKGLRHDGAQRPIILLSKAEAEHAQLIREGATSATIQVAQYLG